MSEKRIVELDLLLSRSSTKCVYVSAFPDFAEFRRHVNDVAWDSHVWICEKPGHLIHYNGKKLLVPKEWEGSLESP